MAVGALPAVQDGKAAVRFLRANAAKYHLDPEKFAVWGNSAGGYMAALLAHKAQHVTTLEIDPELARMASDNLRRAWITNATVLQADASRALPEDGPFDVLEACLYPVALSGNEGDLRGGSHGRKWPVAELTCIWFGELGRSPAKEAIVPQESAQPSQMAGATVRVRVVSPPARFCSTTQRTGP